MELLLIPVLLISGTILVYLGAGGTYPFGQPKPPPLQAFRQSGSSELGGPPLVTPSAPEFLATARFDASASLEEAIPEAVLESPSIPADLRREAADDAQPEDIDLVRPYQPRPYVPEPVLPPQRPVTAFLPQVEPQQAPAVTAPGTGYAGEPPSSSDLLLMDLLTELLEMRKELATVRAVVDGLAQAQTRRSPAPTPRAARTPLFSRQGATVET